MTHEEAAQLLPDHLEGRLSDPVRSELERHASACPDCQALSATYRVLDAGFRAEAAQAAARHPTVDDLVDFALADPASLASKRSELALHLQVCASCAGEVQAVRDSRVQVEGLSPRGILARVLASPNAAPLAAGLILALLGYPAYLGLVRLPRVQQDLEALRANLVQFESTVTSLHASLEQMQGQLRRMSSWTGGIVVPLLTAPVRAAAAPRTTIPLQKGQPFICLAVDPGLPAEGEGVKGYLAEILTAEGSRVWSFEMEPEELKRQMTLAGSVAFLIPAADLLPGDYRFRMTERRGRGDVQLLDVPITIVASAE